MANSRTKWFEDAKFGIFIHWGPYAVIGRHEQARNRLQIPQETYDVYVRKFNPVRYDADEWVDRAEESGARYMVITSKHHDGFSIYRSSVSDYDMRLTPYSGDPLKMLADACARKGMKLGFYHSIMDWRHPDYLPRRKWETNRSEEGADLNRYIDFMKEQLRELLTEYGEAAVAWFDGEWEHTIEEMRSDEIFDFIGALSPKTLVNDRLYKRVPGNRADFGTPEQFVPATGLVGSDGKRALWEACMTINEDSWGYNKYETSFKTERDVVRKLIEVVSKGGNLLLNVGPKADGTIQDEFVSRLKAIGRWLETNGEGIYETEPSCFPKLPFFGRCTVKGNVIYAHVFHRPKTGKLRLPGLENNVRRACLLNDRNVELDVTREVDDVLIDLPEEMPDEIASVISVEMDGVPRVGASPIKPNEAGEVELSSASAEIETRFGQRAKFENVLERVFITNWTRPQDIPTWEFCVPCSGRYQVVVHYGAGGKEVDGMGDVEGLTTAEFTVSVCGQHLAGKAYATGGVWVFKLVTLGEVELPEGEHTLQVTLALGPNGETMTLEKLLLIPCVQG